MGSDDGLIDHLTLVRDRQTVLRGQLTELFMGEAHDYRMRMIIKRSRAVSTEIFPLTSKRAGGRKTRLWLSYHDRHRDPLLDGWSANLTSGLQSYPSLRRVGERLAALLSSDLSSCSCLPLSNSGKGSRANDHD